MNEFVEVESEDDGLEEVVDDSVEADITKDEVPLSEKESEIDSESESMDPVIQLPTELEEIIDYSEQLEKLVTHVEKIEENTAPLSLGSQTIITYGIYYIPLTVIILSHYWFFKQFRDSY